MYQHNIIFYRASNKLCIHLYKWINKYFSLTNHVYVSNRTRKLREKFVLPVLTLKITSFNTILDTIVVVSIIFIAFN